MENIKFFKGPAAFSRMNATRALSRILPADENLDLLVQNSEGHWGFSESAAFARIQAGGSVAENSQAETQKVIAEEEASGNNDSTFTAQHDANEGSKMENQTTNLENAETTTETTAETTVGATATTTEAGSAETKAEKAKRKGRTKTQAEIDAEAALKAARDQAKKEAAEARQAESMKADQERNKRREERKTKLKELIEKYTAELAALETGDSHVYKNGVRCPSPDSDAGKIWAEVDAFRAANEDKLPTAAQLVEICLSKSISNEGRIKSKLASYRKFNCLAD